MTSLETWFQDLPPRASDIAGGKGASLSDMIRAGLPVPPGFIVTSEAFQMFLAEDNGFETLQQAVKGLDVHNASMLKRTEAIIDDFILRKRLPAALAEEVTAAYNSLGTDPTAAIRSSAISEDSDDASFAGQQESFLNVSGIDAVLRHIQRSWASFFTARALFYRSQKGSLADLAMAVVVQRMADAEKSGVMFTVDPVNGRRDHLVIEAIYGLGEGVVSGLITPDHYVLDRDDGSLVREQVATQSIAIVRSTNGGTEQVKLSPEIGKSRVLTDSELEVLRQVGLKLESTFGKPQDVEWCIGDDGLMLLQSRPITTL
jgi:pyruvate,water dikinase